MTGEGDQLTTEVGEVLAIEPIGHKHEIVDEQFHVIGVGASADGLDAIRRLVSQIPTDFSHSMVIIQHLTPDHKSANSEIL